MQLTKESLVGVAVRASEDGCRAVRVVSAPLDQASPVEQREPRLGGAPALADRREAVHALASAEVEVDFLLPLSPLAGRIPPIRGRQHLRLLVAESLLVEPQIQDALTDELAIDAA